MATIKLLALFLCALSIKGELTNLNIQFQENLRPEIDGRIVGGYPATEGQFPHQVHLRVQAPEGFIICGGSIISSRHVLTAANCLSGMKSVIVRMGSISSSGGTTMNSTDFILHPQYDSTLRYNDIAVIILPSDIKESSTVKPIRLPSQSEIDETHVDMRVTISGWGHTVVGGTYSPVLNWVDMIVISNQRCVQYYGSIVINSTICCQGYSTPAQNTCTGDSGGPLIIKDSDGEVTLIGVYNFMGGTGCTSGAPSGYARINKFLDWINEVTGIPIRP